MAPGIGLGFSFVYSRHCPTLSSCSTDGKVKAQRGHVLDSKRWTQNCPPLESLWACMRKHTLTGYFRKGLASRWH